MLCVLSVLEIKKMDAIIKKEHAAVTSLAQLDPQGHYSYADYLSWKFEQALEIIKGTIVPMSAPGRIHQRASSYLNAILFNYLKDRRCEVYAAPFDVRLFDSKKSLKADRDIYTVVQPDLCVVCDLEKLDDKGCLGAPDLAIEILSPGNSSREMKLKKDLYSESGVREYWIVDPIRETVYRYNPDSDRDFGRPLIFVGNESMPSLIFPDFTLSLADLFLDNTA